MRHKSILLTAVLLFIVACTGSSQGIHGLEEVSGHYKELQKLSSEPNAARAHLDGIKYPPDSYNSGSLVYLMVSPKYLTENQFDKLKLIMTPPANSSDQTKAELEFLLEWQRKRTRAQERRSVEVFAPVGYWPHIDIVEHHSGYQRNIEELFFEGRYVLGEDCKAEHFPATRKLLAGVTRDVRIMEFRVKYHLLRARPYQLNDALKPLARMQTPSFASGHTLWAYIQAFTWSELVPEKRKEFLQIAYDVGESREIMGIHYPSDEEAARVLAHQMLTVMWMNTEFRKDLESAKREWK